MSFVSIDLSRKVASTITTDMMIDDSSVLVQVNISRAKHCFHYLVQRITQLLTRKQNGTPVCFSFAQGN